MAKIHNIYENDLDRTWYKSSNVKYSECDDIDNSLKVVRVVFNNGSQYQYKDVDVNDYLRFREADSNGKAFNQFIKKYEFEKLENVDVDKIDKALQDILDTANSITFKITDKGTCVQMANGNILFETEKNFDESALELAMGVVEGLGYKPKKEIKEE
jgi:hypothetical protein